MSGLINKIRRMWGRQNAQGSAAASPNKHEHIAVISSGYDSENIGNDAAARPWDQVGESFVPSTLRSRDHLGKTTNTPLNTAAAEAETSEFVMPDVPRSHSSGLLSGVKASTNSAAAPTPNE